MTSGAGRYVEVRAAVIRAGAVRMIRRGGAVHRPPHCRRNVPEPSYVSSLRQSGRHQICDRPSMESPGVSRSLTAMLRRNSGDLDFSAKYFIGIATSTL